MMPKVLDKKCSLQENRELLARFEDEAPFVII
jgi:hypothetical protein